MKNILDTSYLYFLVWVWLDFDWRTPSLQLTGEPQFAAQLANLQFAKTLTNPTCNEYGEPLIATFDIYCYVETLVSSLLILFWRTPQFTVTLVNPYLQDQNFQAQSWDVTITISFIPTHWWILINQLNLANKHSQTTEILHHLRTQQWFMLVIQYPKKKVQKLTWCFFSSLAYLLRMLELLFSWQLSITTKV